MHYEVEGEGPWALCVSGLLSNSNTSQFRLVPGLADGRRLVFGDHRGGGQSDTPPGPYTIDQIADDWVALMDELGIEKAPVLGNSMGGMVAQSIAVRHPERVEKLVLSCTVPCVDPVMRELLELWFDVYVAMGIGRWTVAVTAMAAGPAYFNAHHETVRAAAGNVPDSVDTLGYRAQMDALVAFDMRDRLGEIAPPTLVVSGEEDLVCRPALGAQLAEAIGDARFVVLPGVGHLAQAEAPEEYGRHLLAFLEET